MSTKRLVAAALVAALFPAAACGSEGEPIVASRGVGLYETNCANCHGSALEGTAKGPSLLSIVYEPNHHTDESMRSAIANGARQHHWAFGDMKPIDGLSERDVDQIIAHVRSEQERLGFVR